MLGALKFRGAQPERLRHLNHAEWENLLARWDFQRFIIPLRLACPGELPDWVQSRIDANISDNIRRFNRIKEVYSEVACAMREERAEHVVLKGFAHGPGYVEHPRFRLQSDIDLYCPPDSIFHARDAIAALGYEPEGGLEHLPTDHLPALVKRTNWKWRGNPYDPDIPISIELHHCLWNESLLHFGPKSMDEFWRRRVERNLDEFSFPALNLVDTFGYAALQVLRDVLGNDTTSYKVYELARFIHAHADEEELWKEWRESHDDGMRQLEAISLRLARDWFDCRMPEEVEKEVSNLPLPVRKWADECADSALTVSLRPNKDALWLHLRLIEETKLRRSVLVEGLLPRRIPPVDASYIQKPSSSSQVSPAHSWRKRAKYLAYVASRTIFHAGVLPRTLWQGFRLWWAERELTREFWTLLSACYLFDSGMYIFFILYNLYLLDRGFKEGFLGAVTSAVAIGSIAGTLPAGILGQRFGLRRTLLLCFALIPVFLASLALISSGPLLLALAFLGGAAISIWAVTFSPAIAELTSERNRTFAFSLVFSSGVGLGVLGGLVAGRMPGWLMRLDPLLPPVRSKQLALLIGCGIVALGALPIARLRFSAAPAPEKKLYPRNPFLLRFLPAIAIWSFAMGMFSPFYNVYFSQHLRMSVEKIGSVYSGAQLLQLVAMLAAPAIFRRFGLVPGIVYTQVATAMALACLAASPVKSGAIVAYLCFTAFQWMSGPGIYSLLMNQVSPAERTGASALNFLVISSSQAVAALVAGLSFARLGYPVVITATAGSALAAALLFRQLLGGSLRTVPIASQSHAEAD
jgi:MFS family permease